MANIATQVIGTAGALLKEAPRNTEVYWRAFGRMLDDGAAFFNPKTGKTVFTNKNITAVIKGNLPEGTTAIRGRMALGGDIWNPFSRPIKENLPLESYYLFDRPCSISSKQNQVLNNLEKFVINTSA